MSHWTSSRRRLASPAARRRSTRAGERRLRGVRPGVEHRLGGEEPADRDAVEPAGEALRRPTPRPSAPSRARGAARTPPRSRSRSSSPDRRGGRIQPTTSAKRRVDADLVPPRRTPQRARRREGLERGRRARRRGENQRCAVRPAWGRDRGGTRRAASPARGPPRAPRGRPGGRPAERRAARASREARRARQGIVHAGRAARAPLP